MSGIPSLLNCNNEVVSLFAASRRKDEEGSTTESFLQHVVHATPEIVPFREFFHAARRVISLGEEVPLRFPGGRTGYIDNLLLTDDGHLIVVEMKLWRNPEAIREVVAQVLEYGLTLSSLSVAELEEALGKVDPLSRKLAHGKSLLEYASEQFSPGFDDTAFSIAFEKFMGSGEILYLIAGDGVHVSVAAIANWINARSGSPFQFGLLELNSYLTTSGDRFIVPRLLVKTKEIARHVVVVEVGGANAGLANVQISEQVKLDTGSTRTSHREINTNRDMLTLDSIVGQIKAANEGSPSAAAFGINLVSKLQDLGFDSSPRPTEMAFGVRDESNPSLFYTLLSVTAGDKIYLQYPYKFMGIDAQNEFRSRANEIANFFPPSAKMSRMPKFSELLESGDALIAFLVNEKNLIQEKMREAY